MLDIRRLFKHLIAKLGKKNGNDDSEEGRYHSGRDVPEYTHQEPSEEWVEVYETVEDEEPQEEEKSLDEMLADLDEEDRDEEELDEDLEMEELEEDEDIEEDEELEI